MNCFQDNGPPPGESWNPTDIPNKNLDSIFPEANEVYDFTNKTLQHKLFRDKLCVVCILRIIFIAYLGNEKV